MAESWIPRRFLVDNQGRPQDDSEASVCTACGVAVIDWKAHQRFHRRLVESPSTSAETSASGLGANDVDGPEPAPGAGDSATATAEVESAPAHPSTPEPSSGPSEPGFGASQHPTSWHAPADDAGHGDYEIRRRYKRRVEWGDNPLPDEPWEKSYSKLAEKYAEAQDDIALLLYGPRERTEEPSDDDMQRPGCECWDSEGDNIDCPSHGATEGVPDVPTAVEQDAFSRGWWKGVAFGMDQGRKTAPDSAETDALAHIRSDLRWALDHLYGRTEDAGILSDIRRLRTAHRLRGVVDSNTPGPGLNATAATASGDLGQAGTCEACGSEIEVTNGTVTRTGILPEASSHNRNESE